MRTCIPADTNYGSKPLPLQHHRSDYLTHRHIRCCEKPDRISIHVPKIFRNMAYRFSTYYRAISTLTSVQSFPVLGLRWHTAFTDKSEPPIKATDFQTLRHSRRTDDSQNIMKKTWSTLHPEMLAPSDPHTIR